MIIEMANGCRDSWCCPGKIHFAEVLRVTHGMLSVEVKGDGIEVCDQDSLNTENENRERQVLRLL